jgi:hypothetical protein
MSLLCLFMEKPLPKVRVQSVEIHNRALLPCQARLGMSPKLPHALRYGRKRLCCTNVIAASLDTLNVQFHFV